MIMKILLVFICVLVLCGCTLNFMLTNNHTDGSNDILENESKVDQEIDPELSIPLKAL